MLAFILIKQEKAVCVCTVQQPVYCASFWTQNVWASFRGHINKENFPSQPFDMKPSMTGRKLTSAINVVKAFLLVIVIWRKMTINAEYQFIGKTR